MFLVEVFITQIKDLRIFIKIASYGTFFIITLIVFIIGVGIYGFTNTDYVVLGTHTQDNDFESGDNTRYVYMINKNFSSLAGMLGIGYFLHTVSVPIVRNNQNPKNNIRDVTLGYVLVASTYILVGTMGYFGFIGTFFTQKFISDK